MCHLGVKIVEGFWSIRIEKPPSAQSLMDCSKGAWKIRMIRGMQTMEDWEVSEASLRALPRILGLFI